MRAKLVLPALAVGLLLLPACDISDFGDVGRFTKDVHYSYPLQANGRLQVETFNGSVEVSDWEQNVVDVSATKYGPTQQEADDLKIDIDHSSDVVAIRVIRPSMRRNNQGASFVIKIPRGALLDRIVTSNGAIRASAGNGPARLRTSNGAIHVTGFHGRLDAQTSNGGVDLEDVEGDITTHTSNGHIHIDRLKGGLEATTSNGGIRAQIDSIDGPVRAESSNGSVDLALPDSFAQDVRASTSNSGITLKLPASANARVSARTSNSGIHSDFDVRVSGEISKNRLEATIGNGGPLLDLSTSNGTIRLVKR